MRALLAIGLNPLGLAILETRGRNSGRPRRTPVGNGRQGRHGRPWMPRSDTWGNRQLLKGAR